MIPIRFQVLGGLLAISFTLAIQTSAVEIHPETGESLSENQIFTYRISSEFSSVDPQLVEDVSGISIARDLFEGLMNQDSEGNLEPGVALGFQVNDGNDIYTFTLRRDARWSNGDQVIAADFVYAWQRAVDPALASPYAWYMDLMSIENAAAIIAGDMPAGMLGIEAIDNHTLEVRLTAPLPYFPQMTTHSTTFPVHRATLEAFGNEWIKPGNIVSNGAYVLTEHLPGKLSVRERNPMYWNNDRTIIERVVALVINDTNTALSRYLAGELDLTGIPNGEYSRLKREYPDEAYSIPNLCTYYHIFNLGTSGPAPLKDVRVRRAMSLAVDRRMITNGILTAGEPEAYTFTPATVAGFEPPPIETATMSQDERDKRAMELMSSAGYGPDNPLRLQLIYSHSVGHRKIILAISRMWKQKLGVEVTLTNLEWKEFLETRRNQAFDLASGGWCGDYNEASTFLNLLSSSSGHNDGQYKSAMVDDLLTQAKTAPNPLPLYEEVERIIANDAPIIPIYHSSGVFMLDDDVRNWPVNNVEQNWYSRNLYKVPEE